MRGGRRGWGLWERKGKKGVGKDREREGGSVGHPFESWKHVQTVDMHINGQHCASLYNSVNHPQNQQMEILSVLPQSEITHTTI